MQIQISGPFMQSHSTQLNPQLSLQLAALEDKAISSYFITLEEMKSPKINIELLDLNAKIAITHFKAACDFREKHAIKDYLSQANNFLFLGNAQLFIAQATDAIHSLNKGVEILLSLPNHKQGRAGRALAQLYCALGDCHIRQFNLKDALMTKLQDIQIKSGLEAQDNFLLNKKEEFAKHNTAFCNADIYAKISGEHEHLGQYEDAYKLRRLELLMRQQFENSKPSRQLSARNHTSRLEALIAMIKLTLSMADQTSQLNHAQIVKLIDDCCELTRNSAWVTTLNITEYGNMIFEKLDKYPAEETVTIKNKWKILLGLNEDLVTPLFSAYKKQDIATHSFIAQKILDKLERIDPNNSEALSMKSRLFMAKSVLRLFKNPNDQVRAFRYLTDAAACLFKLPPDDFEPEDYQTQTRMHFLMAFIGLSHGFDNAYLELASAKEAVAKIKEMNLYKKNSALEEWSFLQDIAWAIYKVYAMLYCHYCNEGNATKAISLFSEWLEFSKPILMHSIDTQKTMIADFYTVKLTTSTAAILKVFVEKIKQFCHEKMELQPLLDAAEKYAATAFTPEINKELQALLAQVELTEKQLLALADRFSKITELANQKNQAMHSNILPSELIDQLKNLKNSLLQNNQQENLTVANLTLNTIKNAKKNVTGFCERQEKRLKHSHAVKFDSSVSSVVASPKEAPVSNTACAVTQIIPTTQSSKPIAHKPSRRQAKKTFEVAQAKLAELFKTTCFFKHADGVNTDNVEESGYAMRRPLIITHEVAAENKDALYLKP